MQIGFHICPHNMHISKLEWPEIVVIYKFGSCNYKYLILGCLKNVIIKKIEVCIKWPTPLEILKKILAIYISKE